MREFTRAFWTESGKVSVTKLMAVIGTLLVFRYIALHTGEPDWTGAASFIVACWGLIVARKHVTNGHGGAG